MEPKLFELLTDIVRGYRRGLDIEPELDQLESILIRLKKTNPVIQSATATKIYDYLKDRKRPVTSSFVGKHFGMAQSTVTTHLKVLVDAKLISKKRKGQQTFYQVTGEMLPIPDPIPKVVWPTSTFQIPKF